MNMIEDRPDGSEKTKALMMAAVFGAYAVLIAVFWFAMKAMKANHVGPTAGIALTVAYVILAIAILRIYYRALRGVVGRNWTSALARRNRRTMRATAIYAVLLTAVVWLSRLHPVHGPLAYALALLPAIPVVAMVAAIGLYFREETDEFERAVRTENALWATGVTLGISTVWGFAEMLAGAPHVDSYIWFPVWAVSGGIAEFFVRRRYR
jgi:cobalamin synthase